MKIGIIQYALDRNTGGIGRYTVQLTNAVEKLGISVTRLCAGECPTGVDGVSMGGAYLLPGLVTLGQAQIARIARKHDLDLIHDPTGATPLALTRKPRIVTIHDVIPFVDPASSTYLDRMIYHWWLPFIAPRMGMVVTDSEQSRKDIMKHLKVPEDRITVVPLAADERFKPVAEDAVAPILAEYGIEKPYILYVGALGARKNLPRLLEAYAKLREWSTDWKLVVVGGRQWKSTPIFDTVQRLDLEAHVHFTGYVADEHLPALYSGADLFVFPSLYEGFGLPVLEAMGCGAPVVTSNSSSLPEVAGDAALLVDPYYVDEITDAMRRILDDAELAADLSQRGIARAAQFSWERTARETIAVYEKVLGKS